MKTVILESTEASILNDKIQEEISKKEWEKLIIEFHYQICEDKRYGKIIYSVLIVGR